MRKGIPHIPLPNYEVGRKAIGPSEMFEGISLRLDRKYGGIAEASGFWPYQWIKIGPKWFQLDAGMQTAVLWHEVGHIQGHHVAQRWLGMPVMSSLFFLFLIPLIPCVVLLVFLPLAVFKAGRVWIGKQWAVHLKPKWLWYDGLTDKITEWLCRRPPLITLAQMCHRQELSADALAVSKGYGIELLRLVKLFAKDEPYYPSKDERISHLLKRIKEHENVKAVWAA